MNLAMLWATQRPWTPFDKDGYVDHPRLKREGFHILGSLHGDDL